MAMKRVSDPQVSPSGKWVMFSVTEVSLEGNSKVNHLWVVPLGEQATTKTEAGPPAARKDDNQEGERQVTFGEGEENGRFSPDGAWVSLSMRGQVYKAPWDEAEGKLGKAVQVTNVESGGDGAVWSPDSQRLLFVAQVYPECSVKGGEKEKEGALTRYEVPRKRRGPRLEDATWEEENKCDQAKDQEGSGDPAKAEIWTSLLYRHWNAFTGPKRTHVMVVDADGKNVRDLTPKSVVGDAETPTFSLGGPLGYAWAPDSHEIAYVTNLDLVPAASTNNDVFTLRLDDPKAKAVKVSTSPGSDDGPQYSPDGRWLAFRSQARAGYESDRFRLMVFDREKKKTEELTSTLVRLENSTFDGWVDEYVWTQNDEVIFTSPSHGEEPIFGIALGLLRDGQRQVIQHTLKGEYSDLRVVTTHDRARDGTILLRSSVIAVKMTADHPSEIVRNNMLMLGLVFDLVEAPPILKPSSDSTLEPLTHLNASLIDRLELTPLDQFEFTGAEGAKVEGFIVKPPNFNPKKKYPVKFLIHGGPQGAWGDAWSYRWNPELMAASGYVVVMVNPRGSTGYGQAFIDGVNGDWGGKAYEDLMKGLDAAEKQFPFIDKKRECALGASYGGFMANWILTHNDRFKCIVTHDGMYNPAAAYGDTEEMWFNEWEFRKPGDKEPGQPWRYSSLPEGEDPFRKWSPALHIQNAKTPTLVIHSQLDYRLDVSEGFQLFTALQRRGVPSKMLYFPDEGHWVLKPKNSELWNKTVGDWCDEWTKTGAYAK